MEEEIMEYVAPKMIAVSTKIVGTSKGSGKF